MAKLVVFDETVRGVELPECGVVIGRSRRVDLPLEDRLLSRKHCIIVPVNDTYCVADLKSANGTFLNGVQVMHSVLEFDDVIEVGNTVLVFLDSGTWERGEGLTSLRNPVKAQELIQRLNFHAGAAAGRRSSSSVAHIRFGEE
jgi:pSer/pThr/pTyr-binding forkhead associated (FHA) protein